MCFADFGFQLLTILCSSYNPSSLVHLSIISVRSLSLLLPEESIICIVTFSGVTSGGMVTSGIRCWTYSVCVRERREKGWIRYEIGWLLVEMITLGMNVSLINEAISVLLPTPSIRCVLVCCACTRFVYMLLPSPTRRIRTSLLMMY